MNDVHRRHSDIENLRLLCNTYSLHLVARFGGFIKRVGRERPLKIRGVAQPG